VGVPVLFGPDMSDFPDIAAELLGRRAAFEVLNEEQLHARLQQLLSEPDLAVEMGARGRRFIEEHQGTTQRVAGEIAERLR
jgi:3-deoxy-D-manno-octulosonic-acid transferase